MKHLYFVRHGKTEWNLAGRIQGGTGDSPLLPQSYVEIKSLATRLSGVHFDHAYVSDQKRAVDTAKTLLANLEEGDVPITYTAALREFHLGKLEGMHHEEIKAKFPDEQYAMRFAPQDYDPTPFGGETFPEMIDRGVRCVAEALAENSENSHLLFVSHGQFLTAVINTLLGKPIDQLRAKGGLHNSSLTILTTTDDAHFNLDLWNSISHLEKDLLKG